MKCLIFCLPRTRSSLIQDVVSKAYNLQDLQEPYNLVEVQAKQKLLFHKNEIIWQNYKNKVLEITQQIHDQNDLVVKIFTDTNVNYLRHMQNILNDNFVIEKDDILDLETYCQISKYDKIFVLTRKNLADLFCSYRYGKNLGKLQYNNTTYDQALINVRGQQKVRLAYEEKILATDVLQAVIFQRQIKKLEKNNIDFIQLDYDAVPNYICENYPNITSKYIETNFDYKMLVKNYEEIESKINFYYNKFQEISID